MHRHARAHTPRRKSRDASSRSSTLARHDSGRDVLYILAPHIMPLLESTDARPIHFVGIAGAGMSALAELFLRRGVAITGCDAHPESAGDLKRLGVDVVGHDPKHVENARALVVTSAMPKDHSELVRA